MIKDKRMMDIYDLPAFGLIVREALEEEMRNELNEQQKPEE